MIPKLYSSGNLKALCDRLALKDKHLKKIIEDYGYPPLWSRDATFSTLVHIILEQQVSLASAKAAMMQLEAFMDVITPEKFLLLSDTELRICYFSRQKIVYTRHLAKAIVEGSLQLEKLHFLSDREVIEALTKIKGIGAWTADVFLMMCLQRSDCFPIGDVALIKSMKEVKSFPADTSKEAIQALLQQWRPLRTIAAFLLWHAYLSKRGRT